MKNQCINEFIEIDGKTILCQKLCEELFFSDWKFNALSSAAQQYRLACRAVADHLREYMNGAAEMSTHEEYFRKYNMTVPSSKTYPAAAIEILKNLGTDYNVDIESVIFSAAEKTVSEMQERKKEQIKKEKRIKIVEEILNNEPFPEKTSEKIGAILRIQKGKSLSGEYLFSSEELSKEDRIAQLWCNIMVAGEFDEYLPFGLLKSIVEEKILSEGNVTDLLRECGCDRDWEWYSEDFLGCDLLDKTIIKIDRILEELEPIFMNKLNIARENSSTK